MKFIFNKNFLYETSNTVRYKTKRQQRKNVFYLSFSPCFTTLTGKNKNIFSNIVAQIVAYRNIDMKQTANATELRINQSVVSRVLARYKSTGAFSAKKRP